MAMPDVVAACGLVEDGTANSLVGAAVELEREGLVTGDKRRGEHEPGVA
jgi:hypothetical protein